MVFTPDGLIFATKNRARSGEVVDANTGETVAGPTLPPISVGSRLALTLDGRTLLVSDRGDDKGVTVWDLASGKERHRLPGAGADMVLAPDGKSVLINDGLLQRWDLATGKPLWPETFEQGHAGEVLSLAFSADGKQLASSSADGTARLWDLATGKPLQVWRNHTPRLTLNLPEAMGGATAVALSPDGRWLVSGGSDYQAKVMDVRTGKETCTMELARRGNEDDIRLFQLRMTPDSQKVIGVSGGLFYPFRNAQQPQQSHTLSIWDMQTGKLLAQRPVPVTLPASCSFSADARTVVVNGGLFDVASGIEVRRLAETDPAYPDFSFSLFSNRCLPFSFSRDDRLVVGGCGQVAEKEGKKTTNPDGLRVWEAATGQVIARLKTKSWTAQVAFLPGNRFVATNDGDGIQVWDVRTGQVVQQFPLKGQAWSSATNMTRAGCFGVTPDGQRLATGHPDGTILLWDLKLPAVKPDPLAAKEVESLWADLKAEDAARAWRAVWRLAEYPDVGLALSRAIKAGDPSSRGGDGGPAEGSRQR